MPRTLPWLNKSAATKNDVKASSPAPKRRKREASPEDLVDAELNDIATPPPRPKQKQRADRTPSTSPAPAVQPDVQLMRDGYKADDLYLMVEDEFESIAKEYSSHLHRGEWMRQKKLAKSRGERTLSAVGHGTDARTEKSKRLEMSEEREGNERKRRDALGDGEESEDELPFMQDPQLAGLMTKDGDRVVRREFAGMAKAKSKTRAAMGYHESPHAAKRYRDALKDEEENERHVQKTATASSSKVPQIFGEVSDDEEDDLDAIPAPRPSSFKKPKMKQKPQVSGHDRSSSRDNNADRDDNVFKRFAASTNNRSSPLDDSPKGKPAQAIQIEDDDDTLDAPRPRVRPTYKKAQDRQASQALNTQATQPARTPLRPTGTEKNAFRRPSFSSSSSTMDGVRDSEPAEISPKKTSPSTQSQGRAAANAAASEYMVKWKAERARKEKEKEKQGRKGRVDDIPTFLY